jgi:hypothetical protein
MMKNTPRSQVKFGKMKSATSWSNRAEFVRAEGAIAQKLSGKRIGQHLLCKTAAGSAEEAIPAGENLSGEKRQRCTLFSVHFFGRGGLQEWQGKHRCTICM